MTEKKLNTLMGFDFGTRNIGVAVGQAVTRTATALPSVKAKDGIPNWADIAALIKEWQPDAVVVGIPLNMDGTESQMSMRARKFGKRLHGRYNLPFYEADERLSSFEAKDWANKLGHSGHYGSNPVDGMAAQIILEGWMNDENNPVL
ncbi:MULTISPECIES: Holliday junction resolvase RuvX [unclassified Endozoicomonas]|uniref:Holliday junction resolvase RuvX n=1 Tax=unclassified Endozoicomonas TaxID=2644528 RepID=UPI002147F1B5|nr:MULTISPECIES: Holliday junction resolvase RuvX [unclassified Endozoicomonas]